jgi:two-component system, chemotaxis family, protein-glutamate methylesterase/glutaminase
MRRAGKSGLKEAGLGNRDVIVLGASAGGVEALTQLCAGLRADLPASVFIVQHVAPTARSVLPELLTRAGPIPAGHPVDGEPMLRGRIYVAPPDLHMLLVDGRIRLRRGPHENRTRPAADVLFRSAAACCGGRVVGVVLTGLLDDGTAGLIAIKRCGGVSVVQDPADAAWPGMPRSALLRDSVDHSEALHVLPALLARLAAEPAGTSLPASAELRAEIMISEGEVASMSQPSITIGSPSPLGCPHCGGVLNEIAEEKAVRFRCQIGHAYGPESLAAAQVDGLEQALVTAVRTHRDRLALFNRMAEVAREKGLSHAAERWEAAASEAEAAAKLISDALALLGKPKSLEA